MHISENDWLIIVLTIVFLGILLVAITHYHGENNIIGLQLNCFHNSVSFYI